MRWAWLLLVGIFGCCTPGERSWQLAELEAGRLHDCGMDTETVQEAWGTPDSIDIDRRRTSLSRGSSRDRYGLEEYVVWTYVERNWRLTFKNHVLVEHERLAR